MQTSKDHSVQPSSQPVVLYGRLRTLIISFFMALIAGLAASLLSVLLMGILRLTAGIPSPVELFGDFYLKHINYGTFIKLLVQYAPDSKTTPLGLALYAMIAVGTGLGLLYALAASLKPPVAGYRPGRREWLVAGILAALMTLIGVVLFWDELRQNLYGFPIDWARLLAALGLLADFTIYAVTLCLAYRLLLPKQPVPDQPPARQGRRQILSRAGVAALAVGAGAGTVALVRDYLNDYAGYDGLQTPTHDSVTSPITPNDEHYVVTQNTIDPTPNANLWLLEITGLVGKSGTYTYTELQNLPSTSRAITLECISNQVGAHLMSTAVWQGVTLRTLLERHGGAQSTARYVAFYSVDDYTMSLPLQEVLDADALLAWRMNGAVLPQRHGFPLRAVIPGRYGEESPKWLTRIELTDHAINGIYVDQGWYNGPLHMTSRIDRPNGRVALGQTTEVGGIAFAGANGIQKVEVSVDNGLTWQLANLQPPLSQDSWVLWTWPWRPAQPGNYTLVVRATDGTGQLQIDQVQGTVPNGATGYHKVSVQVV